MTEVNCADHVMKSMRLRYINTIKYIAIFRAIKLYGAKRV